MQGLRPWGLPSSCRLSRFACILNRHDSLLVSSFRVDKEDKNPRIKNPFGIRSRYCDGALSLRRAAPFIRPAGVNAGHVEARDSPCNRGSPLRRRSSGLQMRAARLEAREKVGIGNEGSGKRDEINESFVDQPIRALVAVRPRADVLELCFEAPCRQSAPEPHSAATRSRRAAPSRQPSSRTRAV